MALLYGRAGRLHVTAQIVGFRPGLAEAEGISCNLTLLFSLAQVRRTPQWAQKLGQLLPFSLCSHRNARANLHCWAD